MYCCFGPRPYPEGFEQKNLDRSATEVRRVYANLQKLPPHYRSRTAGRIIVVAALFFGVVCAVMAANGLLTASPHDVSIWLQNVNWIPVGIGAGAFAVLSIGAGIVIRRVKSLPNELTKSGIGKLSGHAHWQEAYYTRSDDDDAPFHAGYIDTSTLDESGTGEALFYAEKGFLKNNLISIMIAGTSPLRAAAAIAYHIARLVAIPFYILGCLARDAIFEERQQAYKWSDIPKQMWVSIKQIAKAPFYATAHFYAALYALLDPLNARKLGAAIEKDWNSGLNGFYSAGWWTPQAQVGFVNQDIFGTKSLTEPEQYYNLTTVHTLKLAHNLAVWNS